MNQLQRREEQKGRKKEKSNTHTTRTKNVFLKMKIKTVIFDHKEGQQVQGGYRL